MLKATETIVKFKVSEKSKENAWVDLVEEITNAGCKSGNAALTILGVAEIEYMEQYHSEDPAAKTKGGRWKISKYLPNAYKSAKSVICRALDAGVALKDANEVQGKSAVESMIGAKKFLDVTSMIGKHVKSLERISDYGYDKEVREALNRVFEEKK